MDPVTGFALIDEVELCDGLDGSGQLAGGSLLRQLLEGDGLVVLVCRQPVLGLQGVAVLILSEAKFEF